jgi:hypothetical protein
MGLMDEIKQEHESRQSQPRCGVAVLLGSLPPDEADEITAALDSDYTAVAIANVLAKHGHKVGYQVIQRHRRGACGCAQ